ASAGRSLSGSSTASFRQSRHYTRCHVTASTPKPEGGARCASSARRDLCGGRGESLVPTATDLRVATSRQVSGAHLRAGRLMRELSLAGGAERSPTIAITGGFAVLEKAARLRATALGLKRNREARLGAFGKGLDELSQ